MSFSKIIALNKLTKIVKTMLSPAFIVLTVISCGLWFISRLSHTYTSQITIPVELITDYGADVWVGTKELSVRTLVKGDGRDLLLYKVGLGPKVIVPVSALQLTQNDGAEPYMYQISEKSMERALASEQNRFTVMMITDTIERIQFSTIGQAKLPVVSRIDVNCAPQYMVRGGVQLKPDSVTVKAPQSILDTMYSIQTKYLSMEGINSLQSDAIALDVPKNVVVQTDVVRYLIDVVGYTEQKYVVPITALNGGFVVPHQTTVTVRVPLNVAYPSDVNLGAVVDFKKGEKYSRVELHGMPAAAIVMSVEPEFVEVFAIE